MVTMQGGQQIRRHLAEIFGWLQMGDRLDMAAGKISLARPERHRLAYLAARTSSVSRSMTPSSALMTSIRFSRACGPRGDEATGPARAAMADACHVWFSRI